MRRRVLIFAAAAAVVLGGLCFLAGRQPPREEGVSLVMVPTVVTPVPEQNEAPRFSDVEAAVWYAPAAAWAAEQGLAANGGTFDADSTINREMFVTVLWHTAGCPEGKGNLEAFPDADRISSYALPALLWAVGSGVVRGRANGLLDPTAPLTRAEAAQMLMNCAGGKT